MEAYIRLVHESETKSKFKCEDDNQPFDKRQDMVKVFENKLQHLFRYLLLIETTSASHIKGHPKHTRKKSGKDFKDQSN